jgi:Ethanolamine utilization protein EutJ (predicted chaperonin)
MTAVAEYDMDAIYRICGPEPRRHAPPVLPGQRGVDMKQREELKRQIKQTHDAWEACVAIEKRNVDVLREREYTAIMALRKQQRATEEAERQLQM